MGFSFSYSPPEYLQLTHTGLVYFRYRIPLPDQDWTIHFPDECPPRLQVHFL